ESIEFDAAGGASGGSTVEESNSNTNTSQPAYQPPANTQPSPQPSYTPPPASTQPTNQPTSQPTPTAGSGTNQQFFQINVRVRADNASNGWTNSGLVVRRGQRLRITASGRVNLGNNRTSTPDGLPNVPDRDKLMRNEPTGGLIGVIGDDNDDFIFI